MSISLSKTAIDLRGTFRGPDIEPDLAARVSRVLRAAFADQRHATKRLGAQIGRDPRSVKSWMQGECPPSLDAVLDLAAHCHALQHEINTIIEERRRRCSAL